MSLRVLMENAGKVTATPDAPYEGATTVLACKDVSLTRQSEADAADINKIMARYEKTGVLPVSQREALFIDVSEMGDYRSAVEQVELVNEYFRQLPAKVRAEFDNEPARLLDFMSDPANEGRARELGLVEKEEPSAGSVPPVGPAAIAQ